MSELITVWPKPVGAYVPQEHSRKPIEPGQQVRRTRYILRRLRDGSLTNEPPPGSVPEPTPPLEPTPEPTPTPDPPAPEPPLEPAPTEET